MGDAWLSWENLSLEMLHTLVGDAEFLQLR